MTASTVTTLIRLAPGEAFHLPLDARTTLCIVAGDVVVREPLRWLADTVVAPVVAMAEGDCHRLAHAGWVEIQARAAGAEVRTLRSASSTTALFAAGHALWRRAVRRLGARAVSALR